MARNLSSQPDSESGQAAVLIAFILFLGFLAFAALAIDGSMTYLVRRDLQNVADSAALAACRAIANNDTSINADVTDTATNAAQNSIITHLGALAPYASPNVGTGTGLIQGIEISTQEVRVAVTRRVPTVLTQFVGRGDSYINAQARCDSRAGGGLLPIAVPRYLIGQDESVDPPNPAYTDFVAKKGSPLYSQDSVTITIDYPTARYDYQGFDVPVPCGNPNATATGNCAGGQSYVASDGALADSNTGPEVLLLGASADTNNNTSSMRNLVLLDIRNVASQDELEYFNGANSQADAAKDLSQAWIRQRGYPGPFPEPGSQVAILDGASVDFTVNAMIDDAKYQPGDAVAAIVYDGYVWQRPDFAVTFKPVAGSGISSNCTSETNCPSTESTAISYTIGIDKAGPASAGWYSSFDFVGQLTFNNGPLPTGSHVSLDGVELTSSDSINYSFSQDGVTAAGWSGVIRVWSTEAFTVSQFLSGINVNVTSVSQGQSHGPDQSAPYNSQYAQFGFWNGGNIVADHTAYSYAGDLFVRQEGDYDAGLTAYGVGASFPGGSGCTNVPVAGSVFLGGAAQPWSTYFSSSQNRTIDIKRNTERTITFPLTVQPTAPTLPGGYTLRLTVGPKTCGGQTVPAHTVDIPFDVGPPAPTATPDKFVVIQGYAVFRITQSDANDVWAYAISPLYPVYEDITYGLRARLVPWE
jgi:hypothetical protein